MKSELQKHIEEIRRKHPDAVLLFSDENQDHYSVTGQDVAKLKSVFPVWCAFTEDNGTMSFHRSKLDTILPLLVRANFRVAICEPCEPRLIKKRSAV